MAKLVQVPEEIRSPTREEKWLYANITDKFVFGYILETHPDIAKKIIDMILPELADDEIVSIEREKRIGVSMLSKEAIPDVDIGMKSGRKIGFEMQNSHNPDLYGRAEYYISLKVTTILRPGDDHRLLPDVIQIWLCRFDPFHKGRYVYDFTYRDKADPDIEMGDGTRIIFLNVKGTEGNISEEIKSFLSYVNGIEVDDPLCDTIDEAVKEMKLNDIIREDYTMYIDTLADKWRAGKAAGITLGRAEGITLGRTEGAENKLKELILLNHNKGKSPQEIADFVSLSTEDVCKIIDAEKAKN